MQIAKQNFNVIFDSNNPPELKKTNNSSYINIQVSPWGANNNPEGSEKPYKEKGDDGYEYPLFVTAFGGTAEQINNSVQTAINNGEKTVSLSLESGYMKNTSFMSNNEQKFKMDIVFHKVSNLSKKNDVTESNKAEAEKKGSPAPSM